MKKELDIKDQFLSSNKELIGLFNELHKKYVDLKTENDNLINKKSDASLLENVKFGITNLTKLNNEAVFDAINHFNKSCPYCKADLYGGHLRNNYEIDHFFPIAKGGQDVPWNLLPICRTCNRKKSDKLPFEYLDISTFNECNEYLESVLFRITNTHEDKLQRDEITHNYLIERKLNKISDRDLTSKLSKLFNICPNQTENLDNTDEKSKILLNKEYFFNPSLGQKITASNVANYLYNKKPTTEQKKSVRKAMNELFDNCKYGSNNSYFIVHDCIEKLNENEKVNIE